MASRNKLLPVWGSHCWNTCWGLHVSGKGVLFLSREKKNSKDFQSCLPILPAYLPLKFPNGQFPLKIPGPISQAKLNPMKINCPLKKIQNCLPILSAYLPLKFPNGQFPLKIPGPISSTTLEQNKKKIKTKKYLHVVGSTRGWERGTSLNGQKI